VLFKVLLWCALGVLLTLPASIAWHFEWRAEYAGEIAWSFWWMLALGGIGGAGFRVVAAMRPRERRWVRAASVLLVVGPSAVFFIYFLLFLVCPTCAR